MPTHAMMRRATATRDGSAGVENEVPLIFGRIIRARDLAERPRIRNNDPRAMPNLQNHLRNTFLAGIFAAIPIAVTVFIVWWVESKTRPISHWLLGREIPFVGVAIALAAIYASGLVATTLLGKVLLR